MRPWLMASAVVLLLGCGGHGASAPEISRGPQAGPENHEALLQSLTDRFRSDYPGFTFAPVADLSKYPYPVDKHGLPSFLASGDFDGNGLADYALLIVGVSSSRLIELWQQSDSTYATAEVMAWGDDYPVRIFDLSSNLILLSLKKGDHVQVDEGDSDGMTLPVDTVELLDVDRGWDIVFSWNGEKFEDRYVLGSD